MEEHDEFGIPIKKTPEPVAETDEFGIPLKKKDQAQSSGGSTGPALPTARGTNPVDIGFKEAYQVPLQKEFEKRFQQPDLFIVNKDGSRSTHKMASAEVDGMQIAFPTIIKVDGKLKELPVKEALQHALKNNEFKSFDSAKEAQEYAEGGYKKGTALEDIAPSAKPVSSKQVDQKSKELGDVNPIARINLYTNALKVANKRFYENLEAQKQARASGDMQAVEKLQGLLEEDSFKAAKMKEGIKHQKKVAMALNPNTISNNLALGLETATGLIMSAPKAFDEATDALWKDIFNALGMEGEDRKKQMDQFRSYLNDNNANPMAVSDFLGEQGVNLLKKAEKANVEKNVALPYQGQGWEAAKNGDIAIASEYGAKSFLQSLPTSLTFLNPATAAATMTGMVGEEIETAKEEGRDVNSEVVLAGTIKAGLEYATERMFGAGKATKELIKSLGKEGAERVVRESTEEMVKKSLARKLGQTYSEEIIGEMANQIGSNAVDKYILGKDDVKMTDGVGEAGWVALFGAGMQGTGPVVIKHMIDNKASAQSAELKGTATDLMDKAMHQEDPGVAETMAKQADKLNTEAETIIEQVNKTGDLANPETVQRLTDITREIADIDKTLMSPEVIATVKESLLTDKEALEKEHEALMKQAQKEVKVNEKELAAVTVEPTAEEKTEDKKEDIFDSDIASDTNTGPDTEGAKRARESLKGRILKEKDGKVESMLSQSGHKSILYDDLRKIQDDESAIETYDKIQKRVDNPIVEQYVRKHGRVDVDYYTPEDTRATVAFKQVGPRSLEDAAIGRVKNGKNKAVLLDKNLKQGNGKAVETRIIGNPFAYEGEEKVLLKSKADAEKFLIYSMLSAVNNTNLEETAPQITAEDQKAAIDQMRKEKQEGLLTDINGEPLIFMHAGGAGIQRFRKPSDVDAKKADEKTGQEGIYFSRDIDQADKYSKFKDNTLGEGKDIYYATLKMAKPYEVGNPSHEKIYKLPKGSETISSEDRKALEAAGFDGVIWDKEGYPKHEVIVFEPDQIETIATYNEGLRDNKGESTKETPETKPANISKNDKNLEIEKLKEQLEGAKTSSKKKIIQDKIDTLEGKTPERKKRKLTQTMINKSNLRQEFKDSFGEDEIYYDAIPNDVTIAEANSIIEYLGEEQAIKELKNLGNGMKPAVRNTIAKALIKKLQAEGDYETAISLREDLVKSATEQGQGVQSFVQWIDLEPETEVIKTQRMVAKDREQKEKRAEKKLKKLKKGLRDINKESAKEAVEKVSGQVDKASEIVPKEKTRPADYGSKNKVVTKEKYLAAKKALRGKLFSAAGPPQELIEIAAFHIEAGSRKFVDFAAAMVDDLGNKVKPYLRNIYEQAAKEVEVEVSDKLEIEQYYAEEAGNQWKQRIEKAIASGNKKEADKAISVLQKVSKDEGLWGKYKKQAVNRLKMITEQQIKEDIQQSVPLQEFTDGLIKNLNQQIEEIKTEGPEVPAKKQRKSIEIIGDAFKNIEKYEEVWAQAQKEFTEKYKKNPEVLMQLDAYFGEILDTPFSDKLVQKSVKEGLKDLNHEIADIVVKHYTVQDYVKQSLVDKLIDKAGLEGAEAAKLAEAVQNEFDRIATAKKKALIDKVLSPKERKKPEAKSMEDEIIRLTNLGAFSDNDMVKAYGDKMGWPKLTPEQVKKIEELATAVQEVPDGFKKFRTVEDLLAYQAGIPGVSLTDVAISIWYANILSGQNTQLVNLVGNMANSTALYANAVAQNPKSARFIAAGFVEGFKRGLLEAKATWQTGYSPIRGKVEVPATLERIDFKNFNFFGKDLNPYNYLKYVRRLMVASDVMLFEAQKEMRAYQLAWKEAAQQNVIEPTQSMKDRVLEILNKTDDVVEWAQEEAEAEFEDEVDSINSSNASVEEKSKKVKQAEQDKKRRVYELIEERRGGDILEESASFAARGTYNYKPEGALGVLANVINQATEKVKPLKLIIPFTNIIANVANEALNYTPVGGLRRAMGSEIGGVQLPGKTGSLTGNKSVEMTDQEKADLTTKAIIGTSLMVAAYVLSHNFGDDDDEPLIQITGGGTGDYRKNYELAETGWQPYSIKVGNKWYSYQYTPLMLGLGFVGQIRDYETYRNEKISDEGFATKIAAAGGYTAKSLFDMTFLSSLNSTLSALMDPRNEDRMDDVMKQLKTTGKGFVVPSVYTQTARELENWFNIPTKEVRDTYMGDLLKDVPVARNQYYDKINALGEPVIPKTDKIVSSVKPDKIWQLIADKRAFVGAPSPKSTAAVIYDKEQGKERYMTPEEYYEFVKARGEGIRAFLEKNYASLEKKTPEQVQDIMKTVKARQTKIAKNKLFNN